MSVKHASDQNYDSIYAHHMQVRMLIWLSFMYSNFSWLICSQVVQALVILVGTYAYRRLQNVLVANRNLFEKWGTNHSKNRTNDYLNKDGE